MNDITQFNIITLNNLIKLISPLDKIYAQKNIHLNNETIGKHVRHIIDFYLCFINGIKIKFIDYDKRERNKKVENDKEYAIKTIALEMRSNFEPWFKAFLIPRGIHTR